MDATAELERLADLLRIGADVGRTIAHVRPMDADALWRLADEAERMAADLEAMAKRGALGGSVPPDASSGSTMQ